MYSRDHALLSLLLGVVLVVGLDAPVHPALVVGSTVALGVGIDVDHFVVARLNEGSWRATARVLRNPRLVVSGQSEIFEPGDLWRDQRLLSHAVLAGVLVAGAAAVSTYWAVVVGATLYVHVLADLYSDVRNRERYVERVQRYY